MLNLTRMDLRRLVRTVSFRVMIGVTVFLAFFSVYMTYYSTTSQNVDLTGSEVPVEESEASFGIYVETDPMWADEIDFTDLANSNMAGLLLAILCVIFPPIFVNAEQKHGFIKNIAGQFQSRGMLVLSKLFAVAVQVLVIFIVFMLSAAAMGGILWGDRLVFESISDFAKIFGLHYLLHFAFASLVVALTVLLRGSGFSMAFGILCSTGITSLLHTFANILLQECGAPEDFNIGSYAIESCIGIVSPELSGGDLTRVIVVGSVFLIASALFSMTVMQKRDIR